MEDFVTKTLQYAVRHCGVTVPKDRQPVDANGTLHFENGKTVPLPSLLAGYVRSCERKDDTEGVYRANYVALVCSAYVMYPDMNKNLPLKPMLASRRWIESQKIPKALSLPRCDFVDGGAVVQDAGFVVVIDDGKRIEIVTSMHLERWNLTFPEVLRMAIGRLESESGAAEWDESHPTGCKTSKWGDRYDSTRAALAMPHVFDFKTPKSGEEGGDVVAVFGTAKCTFAARAENLLGLCYMGDMALDIAEKHSLELVSTAPYRLTAADTAPIVKEEASNGYALTCDKVLRRIRGGSVWTRYVPNRSNREHAVPKTRKDCERVLADVRKRSREEILHGLERECREESEEGLLLALAGFYAHRAPHLLPKIPAVLDTFKGKLTELTKKVAERYGDIVPWDLSSTWVPHIAEEEGSDDNMRRSAQMREAGNVEFKNKHWRRAVFFYRLAHHFAPDDAAPLSNLAAALLKLGLHADALVASNRALALDTKHAKATYRSGLSKLALDDFSGALADFKAYRSMSSRGRLVDKKIETCSKALDANVAGAAAITAASFASHENDDVEAVVRACLENSVGWRRASDNGMPGWIPDIDRVYGTKKTISSSDPDAIASGYRARAAALKLYNLVRDSETSKWDAAAEVASNTATSDPLPPPSKVTRVAALQALSKLGGERSLVLLHLANPAIMSKKNVFSTPLSSRSLPQLIGSIVAIKELSRVSKMFKQTAGADPAMQGLLSSGKLRFRVCLPGHGRGSWIVKHVLTHAGLKISSSAESAIGGEKCDETKAAPFKMESKVGGADNSKEAGDTKTTLQSIDQSTLNELTLSSLLGPKFDAGSGKRPSIFEGGSDASLGFPSGDLPSSSASLFAGGTTSRPSVLLSSGTDSPRLW